MKLKIKTNNCMGPMLWFYEYFRRKNRWKMEFLTQNKAKLCKNLITSLVFEKKSQYALKWKILVYFRAVWYIPTYYGKLV
jgi:hypothetical protein